MKPTDQTKATPQSPAGPGASLTRALPFLVLASAFHGVHAEVQNRDGDPYTYGHVNGEMSPDEFRQRVRAFYDRVPSVVAKDCPAGLHWVTDPAGGIARCTIIPAPPSGGGGSGGGGDASPGGSGDSGTGTGGTGGDGGTGGTGGDGGTGGSGGSIPAPPSGGGGSGGGGDASPGGSGDSGTGTGGTGGDGGTGGTGGDGGTGGSGGSGGAGCDAGAAAAGDAGGGGCGDGGCFLTTATVHALGLPDDCKALTLARYLRDQKMTSKHDEASIALYYQVAPLVVARSTEEEWIEFWKKNMRRITRLIEIGEFVLARDLYTLSTARLINEKATQYSDREMVDAVYSFGLHGIGQEFLPYPLRYAVLKCAFAIGLGYQKMRLGLAVRRHAAAISI